MHAFSFVFFLLYVVFRVLWRKLARRVAACISFTRKKNMKQIPLEESLRLWQGASDMFFA